MQRRGLAGRATLGLVAAHLVLGCGASMGGLMPEGGSDPTDAAPADATGPLAACSVQAPMTCPDPAPHYGDVAPIFQQRCVPCHSETSDGPWPLTDYQHIADWADVVRGNMVDCSMPPADAGVGMTSDERLAILTWIRCGLPE